jgi:uncharacterized protein YciI
MYLMISTYLVPLDEVDKQRDQHLAFLDSLGDLVATAGRQDPPVGGVVVLDAATEAEARELISQDPYVLSGAAEYQVIGWVPARGALAGYRR